MRCATAFRSFVLWAGPTAHRFATLSLTSGVTVALVAILTSLFGQSPRMLDVSPMRGRARARPDL